MRISLEFNHSETLPETLPENSSYLLVNFDGDYVVGTAYFDVDNKFACFITHAGPIYPHEYQMWALLPPSGN